MSIKLKDQNNNEIFIAGTNSEDFINDEVLRNDKTWSSNKIVEELYPTFQKEGNPITCYPVENYPLNVKATFSPKQAGSDDPSPKNVRPISGWDEVTVNVRGKNLFDAESFAEQNPNQYTFSNGFLTCHGDGRAWIDLPVFMYLAPGKWTFLSDGSRLQVRDEDNILLLERNSSAPYTVTFEKSTGIKIKLTTEGAENVTLQIELGSTPTPYEPYQPGTTATLTFPETIYGGTVDAVTGVGNNTWTLVELDGTENWQLYNGTDTSNRIMLDLPIPVNEGYNTDTMSNAMMLNLTGANRDGFITYYLQKPNDTTTRVVIWCDGHSLDEIKQIMATAASQGTPLQVAYKLATPESFQATGNQALPAVAGLNTVYTDGDSLIISGKEDIKYTINQITSNIQNINQIKEINNILLGVE